MTEAGPVLIVDDDEDLREMVALVIGARGYRTVEAVDGLDALDKLEHGVTPSLIILDLRMPRMNGIEFLAALRRAQTPAHIPVVVMTGDLGGAREALAVGADACLTKPVDPHVLLDSVRRHAA